MDPLHTKETLLLRIRDSEDDQSWEEFVTLYTPLIYNFSRKQGCQHDDAADVVQEVMKSIARAIRGFEYDPDKGTFRSWLYTATRRELGRSFKKQAKRPIPSGGSETLAGMTAKEGDKSGEENWELDYRRRMFHWAVEKVRPEFSNDTWKAFEETALNNRDPAEVGAVLGTSRAAVYVAKSRVVKRLREKIHSVAAESWELERLGS